MRDSGIIWALTPLRERGWKSMEKIRKEELEEQRVELLPDREEMKLRFANFNVALAAAQQGAQAQANQGIFFNVSGDEGAGMVF